MNSGIEKQAPTPEDRTAKLLESAFKKYFELFGVLPFGTLPQLRAMLCLGGGKNIVRAVNSNAALLDAIASALRHAEGDCEHTVHDECNKEIRDILTVARGMAR